MRAATDLCGECTWRENCQKKSSVTGRRIRCPDFVRDLRREFASPPPPHPQGQEKGP